ncbi:MAG TPA: DUF3048 domain-containing protein [Oscillospiraceae bacterium]|nr:DUF3048 domain-containing protein [Oscillospiraceae bacterium]
MRTKRTLALLLSALTLTLLVAGCGEKAEQPSPTPTETAEPTPSPSPTPEPTPQYVNPLTGMPQETDTSQERPIAIMLNNLKKATPQYGVSQADLIYEVPAEGGITRMLAVFQSVEGVGDIGSVRSTRTYYLDLAQGLDAVLLHAGASWQASEAIKERGVTSVDCLTGSYEGTLFWRDPERRKNVGFEHSVFTSGEKITSLWPTYKFRKEHNEGYTYEMEFADDGTPDGAAALRITVRFSSYKTGVFTYDAESGRYLIEQYGAPYVDGNTGEQVGVTNVLVLRTEIGALENDYYGRLDVDLVGSGEGFYACGGKYVDIVWSKDSPDDQFVYTLEDGSPVVFGRGTSYINIISKTAETTIGDAVS